MPIMQAFPDAIRAKLEGVGFSFHTLADSPGNRAVAPQDIGMFWYCWCGPNGKWDVESGDSFDSMEGAIVSAVEALATYAKHPAP